MHHPATSLQLQTLLRLFLASVFFIAAGVSAADNYVEPPGPWEGFPRSQPTPRYETDVGAKPDYQFGVTKAFSPYKDPDRAEAEGLANPLDNPDFNSYNLIVIVNKRDDAFWGKAQTLRVYKRDVGLLYYWLISSGAKGWETPSGYYRPQHFSSRHWSSKFDAPMLWAVFFNGGMALHSSLDRQAMREMGNAAASHGCVHVEDYRAEELFHLVGHSGFGPVDVVDRASGRKTGGKAQSYKTLIIVGPVARWGRKDAVHAAGKDAPADKTTSNRVKLKNVPPAREKKPAKSSPRRATD
ncbi:MAG: L,D-transpeptidase [Methylococcus sp.]